MKLKLILSTTLLTSALLATTAPQARTLIQNKGSDTLVNVAQAWAEAYPEVNPDVAVSVSGGGSGTGIAAMINGTVDIANASRKMKEKEMKLAQKNGQNPIEHVVGFDALAVFVHKDNPVKSLSLPQLKDIYSRDPKVTKWSDLGITVPGCKDKLVVVSRQNNSGTYAYFKKAVLGKKGKYRTGTLDMHGSKDVVDLVENTPCAIGYSGLAYATDHLKMACIATETGGACVDPSVETASDRSYPIARPLFMYTNGEPQGEIKNYLDWIMSDTGQCIIVEKGYAPVRDVTCK
ncbi:MAG: PstS family phosphate ABC transporter substrate-binding protein [Halobacteria archaeon]|nr:PstS family phosphate ABC transporter substrate-binding protein [Halobacteria archaeon]